MKFVLNSNLYELIKWVSLVLLPAAGALYFGLGQIWHFPAIEEVIGSITVVDTFLGVLVTKTSANNVAGDLVLTQSPEDGSVTGIKMMANRDPLILDDQSKVVFMVKRQIEV